MRKNYRLFLCISICIMCCMLHKSMCLENRISGHIIDIGSQPWLFVDNTLIENAENILIRMHRPIARESVFTFDAPWEGMQSGYITMLQDKDGFRMYYRGGGDLSIEYTCVAESSDGIHWKRPSLGLIDINGSKDNNAIWTGKEKSYRESHNFTPFIDTNPAASPEQRYKAVALSIYADEAGDRRKMLVSLVSPDGINWKRTKDAPIISDGSFDSQNTAFWDSNIEQYVCYFRGGRDGYRSVKRAISKDFETWSDIQWLDFGNSPLEHFYTNAMLPYFRAPMLYLGFPMRFVPERKTVGADNRKTDGLSDAVFISSYDGINWSRTFKEAFIRPGLNPNNWGEAHGNNTPAWGLLRTAEDEISIYWQDNGVEMPKLQRGTLRLDGFTSINAPYEGGELCTKPFRFKGNELYLNYATSAVGSIRVEILTAEGKPLPGYSLGESETIYGDEIQRIVRWNKGTNIESLSHSPIRLRFVMNDADLYSFGFM